MITMILSTVNTVFFVPAAHLTLSSLSIVLKHGISTMISEVTCTLIDGEQWNKCLEKVPERERRSPQRQYNTINWGTRPKTLFHEKELHSLERNNRQTTNNIWHRSMGHGSSAGREHLVKKPSNSMKSYTQAKLLGHEFCVRARKSESTSYC